MKTDLRKTDTCKKFQEQIEVQKRQIEHLRADERSEMNEEQLFQELRAAPWPRLERVPDRARRG